MKLIMPRVIRPTTSRGGATLVGQRDARYGPECAEQSQPARDDIELIRPWSMCRRIEGDVFRMLYQRTVSALQNENELSEWNGAYQPLDFSSNRFGTGQNAS